jgi:hypothetical protein
VLFIIIPSDNVSKTNDSKLVPPVKNDVVEPDVIKFKFPLIPGIVEVNTKSGLLALEEIKFNSGL